MKPFDLVQGTLDLLILKSLALEPLHGWAIARRIRQLSSDVLLVQQGSLYPALQRLEHQGWIRGKWGVSEQNRRARYTADEGRTEAARQGNRTVGAARRGHASSFGQSSGGVTSDHRRPLRCRGPNNRP